MTYMNMNNIKTLEEKVMEMNKVLREAASYEPTTTTVDIMGDNNKEDRQ